MCLCVREEVLCVCQREEVLCVCGSRSPPRLPSRLSRVSLSQHVPGVSGKQASRWLVCLRPGSTSLLPSPRLSATFSCRVLYVCARVGSVVCGMTGG